MVFDSLKQRFREANTPRQLQAYEQVLRESITEVERKQQSLVKLDARLKEREELVAKKSKEVNRILSLEGKLRKEQTAVKIEAVKLQRVQKEWKYKEGAHKTWKGEHKRVMEQLNKRAQNIEHQEEGLRNEQERILQQQRLLKFHEDRISSQTKILRTLMDTWNEKMHSSGFSRDEKNPLTQNWVTEMATSLQKEDKNLSQNVRFIK